MSEAALSGLFVSGFIASTLLPGGSELLFGWMLTEAMHPWWLLWLTVTAGNTLGGWLTFTMGIWLARYRPLTALEKPQQQRARHWLTRYGPGVLLLSWLPIIGDPLCLLAGWLRLNLWMSAVMVLVGKAGRYWVIAYLI
ncbi:YqaA family protein [Neptuniibacter sp. CAU 1671]|uniref:YqaA family protein n=1 Tax=Neptuniibacter sp. CAU 1671 TaxID=3032593 RepID=UPI0023DCD3B6|nr:YqaA family protein [Neptuniibacter sp. CAU 1671]MDF2182006.1 DedA family protein [Neptuniibacter sp. CAU 1671]